jgi:hypothetical protein
VAPTRAAGGGLKEANIQAAIEKLAGIRRVKVDLGPSGVESLRVLVIPERTTSKTLSDVQEILTRIVGHRVEETRIQVIRTAPSSGSSRRKLTSLSLDRTTDTFSVRAALELSGDVLMGESASPQGKLFERKTIAEAIVKGSAELVGFPLEVQRVYVLSDVDNEIAIVVLARDIEIIVGSAVVRHDEHDAIARATLDALNRFAAPVYEDVKV